MRRRDVLGSLGTALTVGTAGCLDGERTDATPTDTGPATDRPTTLTERTTTAHPTRTQTNAESETATATATVEPADWADRPEEVLGVAHLDGRYHHTDKPFLQEGADVIADLGTNVLRLWLDFPSWYYPYNSDWAEEYDSMVDVATQPNYRAVFEGPFSTYLLKATANHRWPRNYYRDGVSAPEFRAERRRFSALTRHLLETYDGTGKTFVLQDSEADYTALPDDAGPDEALSQETIDGLKRWYRARQTGVELGREGVDSDVTVLHAAELSIVLDAMDAGAARVVNEVLPAVELDLVAYSSYEIGGQISGNKWLPGQNDREQWDEAGRLITETLDYIDDQFSPTGYADRVLGADQRPVFLGEFGAPLGESGVERGMRTIRAVLEHSLSWGVRWAIYWQVYGNERVAADGVERSGTVSANEDVRGFYLVRPDGTNAPTWDYFRSVLERQTV